MQKKLSDGNKKLSDGNKKLETELCGAKWTS